MSSGIVPTAPKDIILPGERVDAVDELLAGMRELGPPRVADVYPEPPPYIDFSTFDARQILSLPEERQREALEFRFEYLRRWAPHSLEAHARLIHRDDSGKSMAPARHHAEWVRILEDRERYPWVCIVVPPGYGKSTWVSIAYPTWRLGATNGQARIGIVSNSAGLSGAFAQSVGDAVQTPAFRATYPTVVPDKKRGWSTSKFFVKGAPQGPNPSVLSSGLGGVSVLGKRFDEIILDDPTTWENARSQTVMDGQRHFLKTTLISRFPPGMGPPDGTGGRMIVVCTRWSERDLVPTLEELGFTVIRMPAIGYWDGEGDPSKDDFAAGEEPLWPERMSREQLDRLREDDPLVFELVYQGNAKILSGDTFDSAWFKYGEPPPRGDFDRVVQFVDTAGGRDRDKGDYFALCTLGMLTKDGKPQFWILDMDRGRYSSLRQFDRVKRAAIIWQPNRIVVEDANEGIALYDRLVAETQLPVGKYKPTKDKEFRALPLAGKYRAGYVYHPAKKLGQDSWQTEKWVKTFEAELEAFPNSEHDDMVDAAAGAFTSLTKTGARIRVLA